MNNDAATILQHYAPGMYSVIADIVMTTLLFGELLHAFLPRIHNVEYQFPSGCLTVLSIVSAWHLL